MAAFSCGTLTDPDGPTVVWAAGEVDLAVAARLGAEIEPRLAPGTTVVLYCAAITGMDAAGPQVLMHANKLAGQVAADFVLAEVPAAVAEVLQTSGLWPAFTVFEDIAEAKAAAVSHHARS